MILRSNKRFTLLELSSIETKVPQPNQRDEIIHDSMKTEQMFSEMLKEKPLGNDLLSQEVALQVPSALTCLTTGFGMGPGVPTSLKSPRDLFHNVGTE